MVHIILCVLFLIIFPSCGKRQFPDYNGNDSITYEEDEGNYSGDFIVLNHAWRRFDANLLLWIRGDQFYAKIFLPSGPPRVRYQQYLHKGSRCPTQNDDLNQDGMIDISEVFTVAGDILIPLDGNLQEQEKGSQWYPISHKNGSYYYSRSASVSKMLKDLYIEDRDSDDGLSKLKRGEQLNLTSRIIVIYGTRSDRLLPVACTVLKETYP